MLGNIEAVRKLVEEDLQDINDRNFRGHSPLMCAASYGHVELVRYLISKGADVNSRDLNDNTILMETAFRGHLQVIEILIQSGAETKDRNNRNQTAFDFAIFLCKKEAAELLCGRKLTYQQIFCKSVLAWIKMLRPRRLKPTEDRASVGAQSSDSDNV